MSEVVDNAIYGYTPSLAWNATFLGLFTVSAIVHSYQAYRSKFWIFYPTLFLGAVCEALGYAARVWSHIKVDAVDPFLMQICLLVLAPVFFSAFLYIVLGMAINRLGQQYSILTPRMYFITFIVADIVSLILQSVGGGQAASGAGTGKPAQTATNIMVAGIIFQLVTMAIFLLCGVDFAIRCNKDRPYGFRMRRMQARAEPELALRPVGESGASGSSRDKIDMNVDAQGKNWRIIILAVFISSAMILLRGFFRTVELSQGWTGYLITHEIYQASLDGIPMVIAVGIFNFIHPGLILGPKSSWRGYY